MLPDTFSQCPSRSSQEIKPDPRVDHIAFRGLGLTNSVSMQEALVSLRVSSLGDSLPSPTEILHRSLKTKRATAIDMNAVMTILIQKQAKFVGVMT